MSTTTIVKNSCYTTYLLPDIARRTNSKSAGKEKTTEPKNKLRSVSDEPTGYSVVEGTQSTTSEPPPTGRAEQSNPTVIPVTARASKRLELLVRCFNSANPEISPSGQRACNGALQFISDHSTECAEFFAVGPVEYTKLQQFIEHSGVKARLTYIQKERTLVVEMPSALHKAPMAAIQNAFLQFFAKFPLPKRTLNINVCSVIITGLGETAFSQGIVPLYKKLRTSVEVNPSLLLVLAAIIDETHQYHAPLPGSSAWKTLLYEPTMRLRDVFFAGAGVEPPALNRPMIVEGHTWCSIAMVRFKVWIKLGGVQVDDHAINIDTNDPNEVAEGIFYLTNNMGVVLTMIERGADAIKQRLIALCQEIQPNVDVCLLEDPNITFRLDLDDLDYKLVGAMAETAYERYQAWYTTTPRPRGTKRNADKLGVSDIQPDLSGPASGTHSKTRKKRPRVVGVAKRK
ncbi:hypothetical protein BD769DRAFT_1672325 [Suillus cothurnatus]|nr:hypothetical protein BD769DRAFT_1672325 [Suillus cothurnatus]